MLVHQVEQIVAGDQLLDTVAVEQLPRSVSVGLQSGSKEGEKLLPCAVAAALLAGTVTGEEQCGGVAEEQLANIAAGKLQGCTAVSAAVGQQLAKTAAEEPQGCTAVFGFYCWVL